LSRALISAQGYDELPAELLQQIAEELNVVAVESLGGSGSSLVDTTVKPNFRTLGKRFGKGVQEVAAAISSADAPALALALRTSGAAVLTVDGESVTLGPDEVFATETPREGWAIASDTGTTVALDLHVTPELRRAGIAREVIRQVQEARKSTGLDVSDRILLRLWASEPDTLAALTEHGSLVADEVLATDFGIGQPSRHDQAPFEDEALGLQFWLRKA
jgi:isoleucyl-tRNA synthetase